MSSVIVQMLPSVTLEPALLALQGFVPQCCAGQALELSSSSSVPQESAFQLNSECVPLSLPCFCWPWAGGAAPTASASSHSPAHTARPDPPEGPWGRQGQKVRMEALQDLQQQVWGHALPGMLWAAPAALLSTGAASRAGLFALDKQNSCFHYSDPQHFSVFKVCVLKANPWTYLCSSTHSSSPVSFCSSLCIANPGNINLTDFW